MKQQKKCPVIVICICFALWFLVIPLIIGIYLYMKNIRIDAEIKREKKDEINKLKNEIDKLKDDVERYSTKKNKVFDEYNEALHKKDTLIYQYREEAKAEAEQEIQNKLEHCRETLKQLEQDISVKELTLSDINAEYDKAKKNVESNANKVFKLKEVYKSFQYAIKAYESGSDSMLDEALLSISDETLLPIVEMKLNCMNVKQLKSRYNQEQKNIQDVFKRYEGRYTTKSNMAIYKLMVIALEAELQNVLYSLKYGKLEDSLDSIKEITSRYLTIAVDGNQSIAPTMKKFIGEIEYLFIEAVKIEYEYYTQKERIKEEQRAIKEQMRQDAAERKALEEQRKKIEKEESKYQNEIESVTQQLSACSDNEQVKKLEERIRQLQEQMESVKNKKDKIIQLQNGKAGYVYVISNLGSFGENVFKVGMTRRDNPMDRVKELGDASVPFSFDVHSFIFTDDAVNLEATLHKELNNKRVNKINTRKEFFNVSLDEIEELVYKHHPTAEFNRTMLAEEYRQSLSIKNELPELSEDELAADVED